MLCTKALLLRNISAVNFVYVLPSYMPKAFLIFFKIKLDSGLFIVGKIFYVTNVFEKNEH